MIHQINKQCFGADQTEKLNMRQKRVVKEEGIEHLHQTLAFLFRALGGGQTVIEETLLAVPHFRNALHVGRLRSSHKQYTFS